MAPDDREERRQIVSALGHPDDQINLLAAKLATLQAQKRGLMQRLLTGEVRVKV
jgi:type I restriction enzyme S subunit